MNILDTRAILEDGPGIVYKDYANGLMYNPSRLCSAEISTVIHMGLCLHGHHPYTLYRHACIYTHKYTYIYIHMYTHVYIHIYIYTYAIYTHLYTCIYM